LTQMMGCLEDGHRIPFHVVEEVFEAYETFVDRCCEYFLCKYEPPDGVRSVGAHVQLEVDIYLASLPERDRHVRRCLFDHLLKKETVISSSHSMDEVDLVEFGTYCDLPGGNILLPGGYSSILGELRRDIPPETLLLGHAATLVQWSGPPDSPPVTVHCQNGRRFTADHLICTLPLGVLQERAATIFQPPLPPERLTAIQRLGFGTVNKIFLEYERPVLPAGVTELLLAWEPTDESLPLAQRWQKKIYSFAKLSETLLLAWVSGEEAEHMETLAYDEVGRVCTEVLAKFLGDTCVPLPKRTICTGWRSQPYTRGSYTFIKSGSSQSDIYTINAPLCAPGDTRPRVLFAGEHCHPSFYSTVHGAYLTGRSVVKQVLAHQQRTSESLEPDDADLSAWVAGMGVS